MKNTVFAILLAVLAFGSLGYASPARATCAAPYVHPAKAAKLEASLVQMFVSCNNPGGRGANSTTETGTHSCYPAETFQHFDYAPSGWIWGPHAQGSFSLKAGKNKLTGLGYPENTDPDAVDLYMRIKMSDIRDENGLANSPADLYNGPRVDLSLRITMIDGAASQPMTIFDFPVGIPIPAVEGKVSTRTSLSALFYRLGVPALPACSTIEVLKVWVMDPNGIRFAQLGTFLD
jgi:hypothetical protein